MSDEKSIAEFLQKFLEENYKWIDGYPEVFDSKLEDIEIESLDLAEISMAIEMENDITITDEFISKIETLRELIGHCEDLVNAD